MTKTKRASLFIAAAVLIALTAGCSKEKAPEFEEVDLTQVADLFEKPLQPNPLALAPEDVIVTVEGEDITHGEIMQAVQATMMQLSRQVPPQKLSQMYSQVYQNMTDSLIANILLSKAAENSSLAVSDEELSEEIEKIKAAAPEGQSLEDALAENGLNLEEWKDNLRSQMLVSKLVDEKTADVAEATPTEIATFYKENLDSFNVPENVTASHILIAFTEEDTDETKAQKKEKLEAIQEQIAGGASFEELATAHSDCPSSQHGGELGSFERGQMVPEFEEVAFSIEPGVVSDIVETRFGYHLIKVADRQPESVRSLADVNEQLKSYLTGQKKQKALVSYIQTLRETADVVMQKQDMDAGEAE